MHELTHNFDVYGGTFKFDALADGSHYWTDIVRSIYPYTRSRTSDVPPDEYDVDYETVLWNYLRDPTASWQACVVDHTCNAQYNGHAAPTSVFYRLVHVNRRDVATRYTAFLKNATPSSGGEHFTDQDKLDTFFEAYSAAAGRNVNCLWDRLQWPPSPTARAWTDAAFPDPNPDCTELGPGGEPRIVDIQPDFMSPVDNTFNVYQDDGSGFSQSHWSPTPVELPFSATSHAISGARQYYELIGSGERRRIRLHTCSPFDGFSGGTLLWASYGIGGPDFTPGTCNSTSWNDVADVMLEQQQGNSGVYSIQAEVDPYGAWPPSHAWADLALTRDNNGGFALVLSQIDASMVAPSATEVRFWIQNYGWVATIPGRRRVRL